MRTDAKIDHYPVKCFSARTLGYGKWKAEVGDIIVYTETSYNVEDLKTLANPHYHTVIGRMAGRVHYAPTIDNDKPIKDFLLVISLSPDLPCVSERWVSPEDVTGIYDPNHKDRKIQEMMAFFYSPEFKTFSPEQLRRWATSGYATPMLAGFAPNK